jgi:cbb3-type cytochrome oxidase maturation protein
MVTLVIMLAIASILAALGLAAMKWGVDTRDWSVDGRPATTIGLR